MPQQGLSVGRDTTLVFQTTTGRLSVPNLTGFRKKQDATIERVKLISGITKTLRFFDGWSGSFNVNRAGPELDIYFAQTEADYYAGLDEQGCQIYETITEPGGILTQWRYDDVMLEYADAGEAAGDASVKSMVNFTASRRTRIA